MSNNIVLTDLNIEPRLKIVDEDHRRWQVHRQFREDGWEVRSGGTRKAIFRDQLIHYRLVDNT